MMYLKHLSAVPCPVHSGRLSRGGICCELSKSSRKQGRSCWCGCGTTRLGWEREERKERDGWAAPGGSLRSVTHRSQGAGRLLRVTWSPADGMGSSARPWLGPRRFSPGLSQWCPTCSFYSQTCPPEVIDRYTNLCVTGEEKCLLPNACPIKCTLFPAWREKEGGGGRERGWGEGLLTLWGKI